MNAKPYPRKTIKDSIVRYVTGFRPLTLQPAIDIRDSLHILVSQHSS